MDESIPAHTKAPASSLRESASGPRGKVVSGSFPRGSIYTHLPEDKDCEICQRTKITRVLAENALVQPYLEQKISVT